MRPLLVGMLFITASLLQAQPYGNEWIDWTSSNPILKVKVSKTGVYRVTFDELAQALLKAQVNLTHHDPRTFRVYFRGLEQHVFVQGESDGTWNQGDYIEFFGQKNDGWFDFDMYELPRYHPNPYYSLVNDTAVYYITWNTGFGKRYQTIANNIPATPPPPASHYIHEVLIEKHETFLSGPILKVGGESLFECLHQPGEGYGSALVDQGSRHEDVLLPHVSSLGPPHADVRFRITSHDPTPSNTHQLRLLINNVVQKDTTFIGHRIHDYSLSVPLNLLKAGAGQDRFTIQSYGSTGEDKFSLGFMTVRYPRTFDFGGSSSRRFGLQGNVLTSKYLELTNFNDLQTTPIIYDLTNHRRYISSKVPGKHRFLIEFLNKTNLDLYLFSPAASQILTIDAIDTVSMVNYADISRQGDYIIITDQRLRDNGAGGDYVQDYADYRSSAAGGGYQAIVVQVDEIVDQFGHGIGKHPNSIRQFLRFARNEFATPPKFVFLIGRGRDYGAARDVNDPKAYTNNYVPAFGNPPTDNFLTTEGYSLVPLTPIGRLATWNPHDIRNYLDKVVKLEIEQKNTSDKIEDQTWTKTVLHFGGGGDAWEQNRFRGFLNKYKGKIRDTAFGAQVYSLFKESSNPVQYTQSRFFDSLITQGVSLVTFFGHSSFQSFEFNFGDPGDFRSSPRFPILLSLGCFSGNIYGGTSLSDLFVREKDGGAIAFISASQFGEQSSLDQFASRFYDNIGQGYYGKPVGEIMMHTLRWLADSTFAPNFLMRMMIGQQTLQGDPAIQFNGHQLPDYAVEPAHLTFEPRQVRADDGSFQAVVILHNIGRYQAGEIDVAARLTYPNGSTVSQVKRVSSPAFTDTLTFTFSTDPARVGAHTLNVTLDPGNLLPELSEFNNSAETNLFIESGGAIPAYPYEFSIYSETDWVLKAGSDDATSGSATYELQIDTTGAFNSGLLTQTLMQSSPGLVTWTDPPIARIPGTVYYWRIRPKTNNSSEPWQSSSFLYEPGEAPGWNQSHFHQYLENDYASLEMQPSRKLRFGQDFKELEVTNGLYLDFHHLAYYLNEVRLWRHGCTNGIFIAVFDTVTGLPWNSWDYNFGESDCSSPSKQNAFGFNGASMAARQGAVQMLNSLPDGYHFLIGSLYDASYQLWDQDTASGTSLFEMFASLGAPQLGNLDEIGYDSASSKRHNLPFVFFGRKGDPGQSQVVIADHHTTVIDTLFVMPGTWHSGQMQANRIGPAKAWGDLKWEWKSQNPDDHAWIEILGVGDTGEPVVLHPKILGDTSLSHISAAQYPWLSVRYHTTDSALETPGQIDYWRIHYTPMPDVGLDGTSAFSFYADTLPRGDQVSLTAAFQNISDAAIDSMPVSYRVIRRDNTEAELRRETKRSLQPGDTFMTAISFETFDFPGTNYLIVEANPEQDPMEHHFFNNFAVLPFFVEGDRQNPLIDVTFDGVRILDGDIVSSKPEILIELKDENRFQALDDTALFTLRFRHESDLTDQYLSFDRADVEFIPAKAHQLDKNNRAVVRFTPELEKDGMYWISVEGRDRSGNLAGSLSYKVGFRVINERAISNVLTYPNPFTTETRFVFTITGDEVPDQLRIQIMTVGGRIVREITRDELGALHVGTNITDFAWDGTDTYGDPLANGLYLYRVVAWNDGTSMKHFEQGSIDRYFKNGIGKMYLAR